MPLPTPRARFAPLTGAHNFRDLGGYATAAGRRTRWGRIWRSDTLQDLTEADTEIVLAELGITTVVDLRSSLEVEVEGRGPLAAAPVTWLHLPIDLGGKPERVQPDVDGFDLAWHYLAYLEHSPESLAAALRVLADAAQHPVVFHCAAGKDRTGTLAALLLQCLGVAHDTIVADYTITSERIDRILERLRRMPTQGRLVELLPPEVYQAHPDTMHRFLHALADRYGGAESWARAAGLGDETLMGLRAGLLDGGQVDPPPRVSPGSP